jgi:hypothetical protein
MCPKYNLLDHPAEGGASNSSFGSRKMEPMGVLVYDAFEATIGIGMQDKWIIDKD